MVYSVGWEGQYHIESSGTNAGSYPKPRVPRGSVASVPSQRQCTTSSRPPGSTYASAHTYATRRSPSSGTSRSSFARFSSSVAFSPA